MTRLRLMLYLVLSLCLTACMVQPYNARPMGGVVNVRPYYYPSPNRGYYGWHNYSRQGWGWRQPDNGWHRGWRYPNNGWRRGWR